jgi:hypothetical protein
MEMDIVLKNTKWMASYIFFLFSIYSDLVRLSLAAIEAATTQIRNHERNDCRIHQQVSIEVSDTPTPTGID